MVYLDLDELPTVTGKGGVISLRRYAPCSFVPSLDIGEAAAKLKPSIQRLVETQTGNAPQGPIRLLTQLRYFGYYFSPLNMYYCFDSAGQQLEAIVAQVSNTPWGQQHCYVLWDGNRVDREKHLQYCHPKTFHVSPFMPMDVDYHWSLTSPGQELDIHIRNTRQGEAIFDARLSLQRRALTRNTLRIMTVRYPIMTAQIVAAIYWQALMLWWKKCPFYSHPEKQKSATDS
jgi:DUF1365 family protein